jgi:hypothetical protein
LPGPVRDPQGSNEAGLQRQRYVFILMPFSEIWSGSIHGLIQQACKEIQNEIPVRFDRADEIEIPGRITTQITDAIRSADAIVADIRARAGTIRALK